jgi:hypothetical protein
MKSITIKGSEAWVKGALIRVLDWFLAYYTEEIRQFISQQKLWLSKNLVYLKRTVEIDLERKII